jgi:hypothetical protein
MRPLALPAAITLGASDHVARWLLAIGHTAITAPQWCALLMARAAFGAAACASAVKHQTSLARRSSSGIVRDRRSGPRHSDIVI